MKTKFAILLLLTIIFSSHTFEKKTYIISNKYISRTISVDNVLETSFVENKLNDTKIVSKIKDEFRIILDDGVILTNKDFSIVKVNEYSKNKTQGISVELNGKSKKIKISVFYELENDKPFTHKFIEIVSNNDILIKRIDLEVINTDDIFQPYTIKEITTHGGGKWKPGLGQPLYTSNSATFYGIEFPASYNFVKKQTGYCGYQVGKTIRKGENYQTYKSVIGVGKTSSFIQDAFFNYINQIRIRPLRLQIQYNTWFDYGNNVNKEDFLSSIEIINEELIKKRNVPQFNNYVIDDGWEDVNADWSDKAYKVNTKFDTDFSYSLSKLNSIKSQLGLWLSPGCLFGANNAVDKYREQGFRTLDNSMSMTGPKYMTLLEDRIIELAKNKVTFFKLDGIFGDYNTREFDIQPYIEQIPSLSKFKKDHLSPSSKKLNKTKYDVLKTNYLVEGTENLINIFKKIHTINPNIYIVISNGAYLSPWWLMYVDAIWLINANDSSDDGSISNYLVYRDNIYYEIWKKENTQFPINSIFNHEPKITRSFKDTNELKKYLLMSLSRGTGLIELYLKPDSLKDQDWDIIAKSLKWVHKVFPYFTNVKMHGGSPQKKEVYGYSGWHKKGGYISFHNPSNKTVTYTIKLDDAIGLTKSETVYKISSKFGNTSLNGYEKRYGGLISISLQPKQVQILEFSSI